MTILGHVLLLVAANACFLVAGAGLTRAFGAWTRLAEARHVLGISYVAGLAAFGVAAQLLYVLGFSLQLWQSLALCVAFAATGALPRLRAPRRSGPGWRLPSRFTRWEVVAAAAAVIIIALLGIDSVFQPLSSWDAWTQWTPKARSLVVMNGLDPHVLGSTAYDDWHLDYPLLVPAVEAFAFRVIGLDYRTVHLQQWFFLFGFAWAFVELLRPRVRPLFVWSGLLAILWAPRFGAETLAANADIPLAVFLGLAGITAYVWITESSRVALWLLALFSAATLATKLEGTYLVLILFVGLLGHTAARARQSLPVALAACGSALVGTVPWRAWVATQHLPATYSVRAALAGPGWHDRSRAPISTLVVMGQMLSPRAWILLVPFSLVAVATLARAASPGRRPGFVVAMAAAVLVVAGLATSLKVPGPSFPFPWRAVDWLLVIPLLAAAAVFIGAVLRSGGVAAWVLLSGAAMIATFVFAYIVTTYPFAWDLGTSSARVVLGPALFLAALAPLMLERSAVESRRPDG
jgi:hypothetical protein